MVFELISYVAAKDGFTPVCTRPYAALHQHPLLSFERVNSIHQEPFPPAALPDDTAADAAVQSAVACSVAVVAASVYTGVLLDPAHNLDAAVLGMRPRYQTTAAAGIGLMAAR